MRELRWMRAYTTVLGVFGIGFLAAAWWMRSGGAAFAPVIHGLPGGASWEAPWWPTLLAAFAGSILAAATVLRATNARFAASATTLGSVLVACAFPVGTAVFFCWLVGVRSRESGSGAGPKFGSAADPVSA